MKKAFLVILGIIFALLITAGVGTSIVLSYQNFSKLNKQNTDLKEELTNEITGIKEKLSEDDLPEDSEPQYVTIAGIYKIEDTSKISDAYIKKDESALSTTEKETLQMASDVLSKITNDKMNLYEKEVAIHDWMVKNIKYDNNSLVAIPDNKDGLHTPHGVLAKKKAVCVGFATTFKLFMNMLDAECMIVHSSDFSHSWDLVKLDDGQWYLTDITFDAGNNYITYANFNCTEEMFLSGHQWTTTLYPKAEGRKYNYCVQNARPIKDYKKLPKIIKKAMDKKATNLFYLLPKGVDETFIQRMSDGISERVYNSMDYGAYYTTDENNQIVMAISLYYKEGAANKDNYADLITDLDNYFGSSSYNDPEQYY